MLKLTAKKTKWFVFPQDPSGEAKVEILHLKSGDLMEIEEEVTRVVGRQSKDGMVTEFESKPSLRIKKIVDRAVVGLEGFEDENGKPMKCTYENKCKLLGEFDFFFEQVEKFRAELAEEVGSEEEAEKN